jgi:hypothetical protein
MVPVAATFAVFFSWAWTISAASIQIPSVTTERVINIRLDPPSNAYWVKLSQDPSFRETTNGVQPICDQPEPRQVGCYTENLQLASIHEPVSLVESEPANLGNSGNFRGFQIAVDES